MSMRRLGASGRSAGALRASLRATPSTAAVSCDSERLMARLTGSGESYLARMSAIRSSTAVTTVCG